MKNHSDLVLSESVGLLFSRVFLNENKEETKETKKCANCLRRVKVFHHRCPHCKTHGFIQNTG
jgi:lipopolysaccharide biosynthesis regulator YciM